MKIRYLTKKNQVTAEQIENYAREHNLPKIMVKQQLENKIGPVLQYWDENTGWTDVEYVTELS